jgi:hypothetical protein
MGDFGGFITGLSIFLAILILPALIILRFNDASRQASRQFTIRGMLVYTFLWAICLSPISLFPLPHDDIEWRKYWVMPFAWIVLAGFYVWQRQWGVLLIHTCGIVISLVIFCCGINDLYSFSNYLLGGMFLGSFAGLIFYSFLRLKAMIRKTPEKK